MVQANSEYQTALRTGAICDWDNVSEGEDPGPLLDQYQHR